MPLLPPHMIVGTRGIGAMPIPVELHDLAFGIANSKASSKSTRRVQLRGARPPICKQTGKRYGFVRKADYLDWTAWKPLS